MSAALRFGIFGSYNASSQGDLAILESILSQITARFPSAEITVFAFSPHFVQQALASRPFHVRVTAAHPSAEHAQPRRHPRQLSTSPPPAAKKQKSVKAWFASWPLLYDAFLLFRHASFWLQLFRRLRTLDVLLIGGGGLLVDLYPTWPLYPLLYTFLARLARTPVTFYAVGMGPVRSLRGKVYFAAALNLSQGISVRDGRSFVQARRLLFHPEKLIHAADPAFTLAVPQLAHPKNRKTSTHPRVGISTVALYRPGDWPTPDAARYTLYIRRMADLVTAVANTLSAKVILFSTNCPKDLHTAHDIFRLAQPFIQERKIEIFPSCALRDLSAFLPTLDLVVGTRLHSLILALLHNVPILALSYQDKVAALCEDLDASDLVFSLQDLINEDKAASRHSQQQILAKITALLNNREAYRTRATSWLEVQRKAADKNMEMVAEVLEYQGLKARR